MVCIAYAGSVGLASALTHAYSRMSMMNIYKLICAARPCTHPMHAHAPSTYTERQIGRGARRRAAREQRTCVKLLTWQSFFIARVCDKQRHVEAGACVHSVIMMCMHVISVVLQREMSCFRLLIVSNRRSRLFSVLSFLFVTRWHQRRMLAIDAVLALLACIHGDGHYVRSRQLHCYDFADIVLILHQLNRDMAYLRYISAPCRHAHIHAIAMHAHLATHTIAGCFFEPSLLARR